MESPDTKDRGRPYVIILSGTHVTGKETLAINIASNLGCRWIKSEMMHTAAEKAARIQSQRGLEYSAVFGRVYSSKLRQVGFEFGGSDKLLAVVSCFHMTPFERNAMRQTMLERNVKPIFVILQITTETLSGRTLGAEEPELAASIMAIKASHIQQPLEGEKDVIIIDSMRDVDTLAAQMTAALQERIGFA